MTKRNGNSFENLNKDQKDFIAKRVLELGSMDRVKEFYFKKCLTSRYAIKIAREAKLS